MPVSFSIDPDRRLTITHGDGVVTDDEFLSARARLLVDPRFDPTFDRIWDFHGVTEARVSEAVAAKLIASSPDSETPICRAVVISERVAPLQAILDFVARMRQGHRRIAAFPDRKTAEEWIVKARVDLPPE